MIPAGIALVNFFVIKSVFAQSDNHAIVFMILGMVVALLWRLRHASSNSSNAKLVASD